MAKNEHQSKNIEENFDFVYAAQILSIFIIKCVFTYKNYLKFTKI